MEAVIFIGVQASGKTSFYRERFFSTLIRLSLDMLRARHREQSLLKACLAARQAFVIDNTNPLIAERAHCISPARAVGFRVIGYYYHSSIADALLRNSTRKGTARVPDKGIHGTHKRLQLPSVDEGFDELRYVRLTDTNEFIVEDWKA